MAPYADCVNVTRILLFAISTTLARNVMQSAPFVRLFVRLFSIYILNRLTFDLDLLRAHVWVMATACMGLKVKVAIGRDQVTTRSLGPRLGGGWF